MASKIKPRDVTPIISWWRNFLGQRTLKNHLRFEGGIAARDQTAPTIAVGPSHKISSVEYQNRDGRRQAHPPIVLTAETVSTNLTKNLQTPIPGHLFGWDKQ